MNKEVLVTESQHCAKVTKDFIIVKYHQLANYLAEKKISEKTKDFVVKKYHQLVEYLAEKRIEWKNNGYNALLGMKCVKYTFVLLNMLYLLTSLFLISTGTFGYLNFDIFDGMWFEIRMLSIFGIVTGSILMTIAIFGMIGALKESIIWANIYAVVMMITFILQVAAAIAAFTLIGNSRSFASQLIYGLMNSYDNGYSSAQKLDWIQTRFNCCGGEGPSDWMNFGQFSLQPNGYYSNYYYDSTTTTTSKSIIDPLKYKTPVSCCTKESGYKDLTCDNYKQNGCTADVREIISETIMLIGTTSLTIAVVQILGIVCAFALARLIRRTNIYRHVGKSDIQTKMVPDPPTYVNYKPLNEHEEIKYI